MAADPRCPDCHYPLSEETVIGEGHRSYCPNCGWEKRA